MGVIFANGGEQKQLVTGGHQVVWVSLNMIEHGDTLCHSVISMSVDA